MKTGGTTSGWARLSPFWPTLGPTGFQSQTGPIPLQQQSDTASGEEELAKLVAWNKNYATVYDMACTYSTLGEAAMEHLEEMDVQFLLSKNTWEGIKKAKVVSFHSVDNMVDIVNHSHELLHPPQLPSMQGAFLHAG